MLISLHPVHDSSVVPRKYNSCVTGDQYRHVLLFFFNTVPGYRFLHHIKCSQDEVLTLKFLHTRYSLHLACPSPFSRLLESDIWKKSQFCLLYIKAKNLLTLLYTQDRTTKIDRMNMFWLSGQTAKYLWLTVCQALW